MTPADLIRSFEPRTAPERRLWEAAMALLPSDAAPAGEAPAFTRQHAVVFWQHYNGLALHKPGVAQIADMDSDCAIHALKKVWEMQP